MNPILIDVLNHGIKHLEPAVSGERDIDAAAGGGVVLAVNPAVIDHQSFPAEVANAVGSCAGAIDRDIANNYRGGCGRIDDNAVSADRVENTGEGAGAVDRESFSNGNSAESARVEHRNLAAVSGLGKRAGKCLARSGATTGVGIVSDAGHPGAGGLAKGYGREARDEDRGEDETLSIGFVH